MLCKNCDTRNEEHSRFCRVCGTPLGAEPAASRQAASYTIANAPMMGPVCPACVRANPVGARFCVYCATSLTAPVMGVAQVLQPAYVAIPTPVYVMPTVSVGVAAQTNLLLRAVWFVLIGWWLGLVWTILAWLFNLTLIGLPVGLAMLNAVPMVMTLRPRRGTRVQMTPTGTVVLQPPLEHPLPLRALWFVFVGWWASFIWMLIAWAFSASILLLPIAFWMFNRVPTITTLAAER